MLTSLRNPVLKIIQTAVGLAVFGFFVAAEGFELLLDPGHSPKSPGALSCTGVYEYQYNNRLTEHLARSLRNAATMNARLSKGYNEEIRLSDRVRTTSGIDLFISIHHDSVQPQFLEPRAPGSTKGNCSHKASGFSIFVSRKNPFLEKSLKAARNLGKQMVAQGFHPSLHHAEPIAGENRPLLDKELGIYAFDDLVVLKEAQSPALLFEAGVIVNPVDEAVISQDVFQQKVAQAFSAALSERVK
jgi:N-acetylmuramoyl-L-alanine amidase